jgi:DNA-binding NtrC family response regulator
MVVAATMARCSDALEWLATNQADVALLDMHLLDGSCEPVARRLTEMAIPFVVFSGGDENDENIDAVFARGSFLSKPAAADRIVTAIMDALGSNAVCRLLGSDE